MHHSKSWGEVGWDGLCGSGDRLVKRHCLGDTGLWTGWAGLQLTSRVRLLVVGTSRLGWIYLLNRPGKYNIVQMAS